MSEQNKKSFNLIDEPWIPVAGEKELRSLRTIFSGAAPRDLSGNPVEKIVLFRLLLSIAHAAVKIPDTDAWRLLTPQQIAESVCKYLEEHHDLFDLYDPERPFLQFPKLAEKGKVEDFSTLKAEVATGNRSVLTAWSAGANDSDAEKALTLLCSCGFGRGGKKYDSSLVLTKGYVKGKTGRPGTLLGSYYNPQTLIRNRHQVQTATKSCWRSGTRKGGIIVVRSGGCVVTGALCGSLCSRAREWRKKAPAG